MEIQDAVRMLLNDMNEAFAKGDTEKVQEIALNIAMIEEHCDLFEDIVRAVKRNGKDNVLKQIKRYLEETQQFHVKYGFKNLEKLEEDLQQVIEFVGEAM